MSVTLLYSHSTIYEFLCSSGSSYKITVPQTSRSATSSPVAFTSATPQQLASQQAVSMCRQCLLYIDVIV